MERTRWYKDRVFYQIWPRSFQDGNGDGIGDLWGVLDRLDYIQSLGCDGIWFSPLYPSPGVDCGYDVSDYRDIAPEYGGMEAFRKVLEGAHQRGMKVIMDLVVNHTSDEHEWFQKSRRRIEPYTDYYIWRPAGKNGKLPNNWDSMFEGKAWQWDDLRGEYYLHLFAIRQPDLNMDNPLVREEVKGILRFWLDLGVDGFREDVITFISKKEGLPNDLPLPFYRGIFQYNHGPHIHEYLSEFRRDVLSHYDCMTLAESSLITPKRALSYIAEREDSELDMIIQFETSMADCFFIDFLPMKFSLRRFKRSFARWQKKLRGRAFNMLYLENHDHPRAVSRYGSTRYHDESAKLLAVMLLFMQGTPFLYQGQEIGMTNFVPKSLADYEDVQTLNTHPEWPEEKRLKLYQRASRDNARTPMQWDSGPNAGFTTGTPWFTVNEDHATVNVAAEEQDPGSVLQFYRRAIALRKSLPIVRSGSFRLYRPLSRKVFMYERVLGREKLLVICPFSDEPLRCRLPKGYEDAKVLLGVHGDAPARQGRVLQLRPWEAVVLSVGL